MVKNSIIFVKGMEAGIPPGEWECIQAGMAKLGRCVRLDRSPRRSAAIKRIVGMKTVFLAKNFRK